MIKVEFRIREEVIKGKTIYIPEVKNYIADSHNDGWVDVSCNFLADKLTDKNGLNKDEAEKVIEDLKIMITNYGRSVGLYF